MEQHNAETVRAAAYLATRERLDRRANTKSGTLRCVPPNRPCGDRCIPPNWKCRLKGEGTDSHSRVVAGDPLAGAASIARGRQRLAKGLASGNVTEIQAGRAAIARGIVKSVPGQNIKQKNQLRKNVEQKLLPIATGLFGIWAISRAHEAAKQFVPGYATGIGRNVERTAGTTVGFVLDRIPLYGQYRHRARKNAEQAARNLGGSIANQTRLNPNIAANNREVLPEVSQRTITGVQQATLKAQTRQNDENYYNYRGRVLAEVFGAGFNGKTFRDGEEFQSIYARPATVRHLARTFGFNERQFDGADHTGKKDFVVKALTNELLVTQSVMRRDMAVRGLNYTKDDDVERYLVIATRKAARNFRGMSEQDRNTAVDQYVGTLREIVGKPPKGGAKDTGPSRIANQLFDETEKSFNTYFREGARALDSERSANRVLFSGTNTPTRSTLIGTANLLKGSVGISAPVAGAGHAELILQKHFHERAAVGGNYRSNRKGATWAAKDDDIKNAARDLGWEDNGNPRSAYDHLQRTTTGFRNLEPPTVGTNGASQRRANRPTPVRTGPKRNRTSQAARDQRAVGERARRIRQAALERGENMSAEAAFRQALAELSRGDSTENGMPPRVAAFLQWRLRQDKACGASFIPDNKKCTKQTAARSPKPEAGGKAPRQTAAGKPIQHSEGFKLSPKLLLGAAVGVAGIGLAASTAAAIDDVVRTRSRQFGEPTFQTFTEKLGEPDKFNAADKRRLSAGAFGETSLVEIEGKTYVVKNPKMPDKATRRAMSAGLNDKATRNLYRAQGRMTKSEVANARLAAEIGVAPKVIAADRKTLVTEVAKGKPATRLTEDDKVKLHQTLAKLHRAGIAHNDLKPDNFFMDEKRDIQLIDFGLSMRSPSGVAREWYRAMNPSSPNSLLKVTGTATGSFNLKKLNPKGYKRAEEALKKVIGASVTEDNLIKAGNDPKKAKQMQLVINNYYSGRYNYPSIAKYRR